MVADLARQFVCVRIQSMNGQNIHLFQFDYDLTWMAFFMDGRDRFYARYGGRDDAHAESYLSQASLVWVMRQGLELRKRGAVQTSRHEPTTDATQTPEDIPGLTARIGRRKEGHRCIHCHDVKQAELDLLRQQGRFSKEMIYTYPLPTQLGIEVDRTQQNRVTAVRSESNASRAGLRAGDVLSSLDGQRVLTVADFARVLELSPQEASLPLRVVRAGQSLSLALRLTGDWRKSPDPSWRSSTYLAGPNGGFWANPLSAQEKRQAGIPDDQLALRVTFFFQGQTAAKRSGLQLNDVIVEVDGNRRLLTTKQLHTHFQMNHNYGDKVPLLVRRGKEELKLVLELPDQPARLN